MSDTYEQRIRAAIEAEYGPIKDAFIRRVVENFVDSTFYYVEFNYPNERAKDPDFCYVRLTQTAADLYDDGVVAIQAVQTILDKRRTFLQRLTDFTLTELVGATIAISMTIAFVVMTVRGGTTMPQEFLTIFSVVAGYYFGKNVK